MRQPTDRYSAWAWWRGAVDGRAPYPPRNEVPECGFYRASNYTRGAPKKTRTFVPAMIDLQQEICPETGELLSDETLACVVGGVVKDPIEQWSWLAKSPITEEEFRRLCNVYQRTLGLTDLSMEIIT